MIGSRQVESQQTLDLLCGGSIPPSRKEYIINIKRRYQ